MKLLPFLLAVFDSVIYPPLSAATLYHSASRLDEERELNDPSVRGQIQTESMHLGIAIQHLGALLLELGRTILTLRLGQSPVRPLHQLQQLVINGQ